MRYDILVLRALVRLSVRGAATDLDNLLARVGGDAKDVRASLRRLDAAGLVVRTSQDAARLTLEGLTAGIAAARLAHDKPSRVRLRVRTSDVSSSAPHVKRSPKSVRAA